MGLAVRQEATKAIETITSSEVRTPSIGEALDLIERVRDFSGCYLQPATWKLIVRNLCTSDDDVLQPFFLSTLVG